MHLTLNPDWLRTSMKLWREVVEGKIPTHDKLKVHLITQHADNLQNFVNVGKAWLTVLKSCTPASIDEDKADFEMLLDEIKLFVKRAESSLDEMQMLGTQEVLIDGVQEMLADPEIGPSIRKMLDSLRKNTERGPKCPVD